MAIKSKEEILASLRVITGEEPDENGITFLEDISDTIDDLSNKVNSGTDWKARYEENDASWKKKYTERFYSSEPKDDHEKIEVDEPKKLTRYEDLFTIK